MEFNEFFDSDDPRHLEAYDRWRRSGIWPPGFLPRGLTYRCNWRGILDHRVAARWPDRCKEAAHA